MDKVRVRFAPSPTGTLHIGGARTALFNWLYARNRGGKFVLRLEDTDWGRSSEDSAAGIIEGMRWLGLDWDEGPDIGGDWGPYRQSQRLDIYWQYLQQLLEEGKAYYCFCTPEELQEQRSRALGQKANYHYEKTCSSLSQIQIKQFLDQGRKPVIRLKVEPTGKTVVPDLIRGNVEFDNSLLDDFIIAKSDGWPTYNFAVVVDDHTMEMSQIIRAEEHLSNTPKQLQVYASLGWTAPQFAHVSMILAPDRSKLSKRHGATSVQEFRDQGYLPEALVNYLALLGWSPGGESDIFAWEEMASRFSLEQVNRAPAVYDLQKLNWMNGYYISAAKLERIVALVSTEARRRAWLGDDNHEYFSAAVDLVRSRAKTINEILDLAEYFFLPPQIYEEKGIRKYFAGPGALNRLRAIHEVVEHTDSFDPPALETELRSKAQQLQLKASDLIHPARLALTGRLASPGLFEIMSLLGRTVCRERILQAMRFATNMD